MAIPASDRGRAAEPTGDLERRDELARVTRRVLRGVHQEAEHGRRQRGSPDRTNLAQRGYRRSAELLERSVDRRGRRLLELGGALPGTRLALTGEPGELLRRQPLAARVGQQPIEAAGQMAHVKS